MDNTHLEKPNKQTKPLRFSPRLSPNSKFILKVLFSFQQGKKTTSYPYFIIVKIQQEHGIEIHIVLHTWMKWRRV